MRFLIDECLSVDLVSVAHRSGHEAQHVARIGKAGWKDWNVMRHARDGDFVLVTNNASDFRRLYADESIHAGLVIIIPNVDRTAQRSSSSSRARSMSCLSLESPLIGCSRSTWTVRKSPSRSMIFLNGLPSIRRKYSSPASMVRLSAVCRPKS